LNAQKLKVIQEIETNDLSTKTIESETIETETIETTTQNATYSNIENANITNLNVTSEENINIQTTQILGLNGIIMINDNELTASAHQLNYNDISVEGQAENNRVLVLDENKNISGINNILCSNISGTILTQSQPNITSVGTLSSLNVTNNISCSNISGIILTQSQPNITSVGTLSSLNVTNNISCSNISGIILTQSQPNISHVGTLDELKVNSLGIINLYGSRITITSDIIPLGTYNLGSQTLGKFNILYSNQVGGSSVADYITNGYFTNLSVINLTFQNVPSITTTGTITINQNDLIRQDKIILSSTYGSKIRGNGNSIEICSGHNQGFMNGEISFRTNDGDGNYTSRFAVRSNLIWLNVDLLPVYTNTINLGSTTIYYNSSYITNMYSTNMYSTNINSTNISGTLTTAIQPIITSLGTLSALNCSGNISVNGTTTTNILNTSTISYNNNIVIMTTVANKTITLDSTYYKFTGSLVSDIVPYNNTYNLGSSSYYFNNCYLSNISNVNITTTNANITNLSVTNATINNFTNLNVNTTNNIYLITTQNIITRTLLPQTNNTYSLGGTLNYYNTLYINSISLTNSITPLYNLTSNVGGDGKLINTLYAKYIYSQSEPLAITSTQTNYPAILVQGTGGVRLLSQGNMIGINANNQIELTASYIAHNCHFRGWVDGAQNLGELGIRYNMIYVNNISSGNNMLNVSCSKLNITPSKDIYITQSKNINYWETVNISDPTGITLSASYSSVNKLWTQYIDSYYNYTFCYSSGGGSYEDKGWISRDASNQMNFTGQHHCINDETFIIDDINKYIGLIVVTTGKYSTCDSEGKPKTGKDAITINNSLPIIKLSNSRKQKSVFGVISNKEEGNKRAYAIGNFNSVFPKTEGDDRLYINGVGEGAIYIVNTNGNLSNGDYVQTSFISGYGEKQEDDIYHNYTVCKITCDCDFDLNSDIYECSEFVYNYVTYRKAFVGCIYLSG
jgi:hypothetical protein